MFSEGITRRCLISGRGTVLPYNKFAHFGSNPKLGSRKNSVSGIRGEAVQIQKTSMCSLVDSVRVSHLEPVHMGLLLFPLLVFDELKSFHAFEGYATEEAHGVLDFANDLPYRLGHFILNRKKRAGRSSR